MFSLSGFTFCGFGGAFGEKALALVVIAEREAALIGQGQLARKVADLRFGDGPAYLPQEAFEVACVFRRELLGMAHFQTQ